MRDKRVTFIAGLTSAILYCFIFYWLERQDSLPILLAYLGLFATYLYFLQKRSSLNFKHLIGLAIIFRLISIAAIPALSDDFYRFIWDGILWSNDINPFAYTPEAIMEQKVITVSKFVEEIYLNLNANTTFTVYPTIPQLINLIAYKTGGDNLLANIIIQRFFVLSADFVSIYFLIKILDLKGWDRSLVMIYALNPLVILELNGNLHHEAFMIAFLLGFIYLDLKGKTVASSIMLALSIGAKLLPLMFLPFLILRSNSRLKMTLTLLLSLIIIFFPFLDQDFVNGMTSSLTLYYQKFEFNAGLYYLARELGYWFYGYNAITLIGKIFLFTSFGLVLIISYWGYKKGSDKASIMSIIYLAYALLSLILHPWYILILIALAPITRFRFSITWSMLVFLTYLGYYSTGYSENYYVVMVEYLGLALAIYIDWKNQAFDSDILKEAP